MEPLEHEREREAERIMTGKGLAREGSQGIGDTSGEVASLREDRSCNKSWLKIWPPAMSPLSLSFQRKLVKSGTVAYIMSSSQRVGRWNGQWFGLVELLMEFEK
jgi:hypothetical protein